MNLTDAPAVWRPRDRWAIWRLLLPALEIGLVGAVVGLVFSAWTAASVILLLAAMVFLGGCGNVLLYDSTVGEHELLFADEWLGVRRGANVHLVRYDEVGSVAAFPASRFPEWRRGHMTALVCVRRADGWPARLPDLATFSRSDREAFVAFVDAECAKHGLRRDPSAQRLFF